MNTIEEYNDTYELSVNTYETVQDIKAKGEQYTIKTSKATYPSKTVIVATGFFDHPNLMDVPGENLPKVKHYFDDPHPYVGHKVMVVGGAKFCHRCSTGDLAQRRGSNLCP